MTRTEWVPVALLIVAVGCADASRPAPAQHHGERLVVLGKV